MPPPVRSRVVPFAVALLPFLACEEGGPPEDGPQVVPDTAAVAGGSAIEDDSIPTRSSEVARDEGSRPQEVMDFVGVDRGDQVADLVAGDGYFTYLLSERVGPEGRVHAQGYSPGLAARVERGDLSRAGNVVLVDSLSELPSGSLDAVLLIRAFHLFEDPAPVLVALSRALEPGGTVGVVEVRLGQDRGHDMETHRMGEQTVIDEFREAGFEYVEASPVLRNPEDDHTEFWEGRRHLTDRMLLKFAKPGEPAPQVPPTARRSG